MSQREDHQAESKSSLAQSFDLLMPVTDLPILGRAICFTQSVDSNVDLIQKQSHRHTQNV